MIFSAIHEGNAVRSSIKRLFKNLIIDLTVGLFDIMPSASKRFTSLPPCDLGKKIFYP